MSDFVFIGLGRVADVHYAALRACADDARLVAICDPNDALASAAQLTGACRRSPRCPSFSGGIGRTEPW